jgi:hypothetical protein
MNATEKCPWCGSVISHQKFVEIEARIREEQKSKLADLEQAMRRRLDTEFSQKIDAARAEAVKLVEEAAAKRLAVVSTERQQLLKKFQEAEAREAEARKRAQEEAERAKTLQRTFDQQLVAAQQAAEKRAKEETEAMLKKEMERQRIILQQAHDADLRKERSESNRENEVLLKKVQDMQRKLEQKTADQLGDGAEVDLYETLKENFPADQITRVPKGQPGPDIRHRVVYKGEACGQIVYDSKNQQQWREAWVTKLRQDQIDAGAEHAVLATIPFPKYRKYFCVESGVILVNPTLVVYITQILRDHIIRMHVAGLSQKERADKTGRLYDLIASNEYVEQFNQVKSLTDELLEVDVKEKKAHDKVWNERGQLLRKQQHALREIDAKVSAIVEGPVARQGSAA